MLRSILGKSIRRTRWVNGVVSQTLTTRSFTHTPKPIRWRKLYSLFSNQHARVTQYSPLSRWRRNAASNTADDHSHQHHAHSHEHSHSHGFFSHNHARHFKADSGPAIKITWIGLFSNLSLSIGKAVSGILGNSSAMIADAAHSLSDLLSDIVTLFSVKISRLPQDENHPYGHGKIETLGTFIVSLLVFTTGLAMGYHSVLDVFEPHIEAPTSLALYAAIASICVKETLYHATLRIARASNSKVLVANAWHHRTDSISSFVALLGILGAQFGFSMLDPVAGIAVALLIMKTGVSLGWESVKELTDEAVVGNELAAIQKIVRRVDGVEGVDRIRARRMGPDTLVDMRVQVDGMMSVSAANHVAEHVRLEILQGMPNVKEVLVHIDPVAESGGGSGGAFGSGERHRPQKVIEDDVRRVLKENVPEVIRVSHFVCHFLKGKVTASAAVVVDPDLKVSQVQGIASKAREVILQQIPDISDIDLHLELSYSH